MAALQTSEVFFDIPLTGILCRSWGFALLFVDNSAAGTSGGGKMAKTKTALILAAATAIVAPAAWTVLFSESFVAGGNR